MGWAEGRAFWEERAIVINMLLGEEQTADQGCSPTKKKGQDGTGQVSGAQIPKGLAGQGGRLGCVL